MSSAPFPALEGVMVKVPPEQMASVLSVNSGVGLTSTVRSKAVPVQDQLIGVIVYTIDFWVLVVFRRV